MGNCVKRTEQENRRFNEHSHIQRKIRFGLVTGKDEEGQMRLAGEMALNKQKDKEFTTIIPIPIEEPTKEIEKLVE